MPFEIVRNDIVNMKVDAVVNTANPDPIIGYGVDAGVHQKAGKRLLIARKKIGKIRVGDAVITPAFDMNAKYVIHTVGPVWQGGKKREEKLLKKCYERSLKLALDNKCESVAFPLISAGNHGFPKSVAFEVAINVFSKFLLKHEMKIYLVVFGKEAFSLSEKLFDSVKSYIGEKYIVNKTLQEYGVECKCDVREAELHQICSAIDADRRHVLKENFMPQTKSLPHSDNSDEYFYVPDNFSKPSPCKASKSPCSQAKPTKKNLDELLKEADAGFSETLLKLIDKTGKKDSDIYKKANIDRKLFSKIRNNPLYKPSKQTALAFAIALELDLEETKDFIARAGYALSHSSKFDIIIEYFISNNNYDMFEINETLFAFDQNLLGA